MPVHSIAFRGNQIGAERVRYLLAHPSDYPLQSLTLTTGKDSLKREQLTATSAHNSRGERVALVARTEWFSDGLRYHRYFNVRGASCESGSACTEGRRRIEDSPDSGAMIMLPENARGVTYNPVAVYRGDFNRDGRPDLMVVLENGAALVFEQRP